MALTLGADPEVFVKRGRFNASAHGMIPGTKERPYPVKDGAVQVDGMALEFNIDPVNRKHAFVHNIQSVLGTLQKMLPEDHRLNIVPAVRFTDNLMAKQPDVAKRLGCEADYNAWTETVNPPPDNNTNLRTAAGHIHIGWGSGFDINDPAHFLGCCQFTRQLDVFLGLSSLLFDDDKERRKLYGQPGAFRPKSYGLEYRVLSNFWLKHPALQEMVYDLVHIAYNRLLLLGHEEVSPDRPGYYLYQLGLRFDQDLLINTINNSDVNMARDILHHLYSGLTGQTIDQAIEAMKEDQP